MIIKHTLPEDGNETAWFDRLNEFEQAETMKQVRYKKSKWPNLPNGIWSKRPNYSYPHILPTGNFDKALYESIAEEVYRYCEDNEIAIHAEILNLRSSQAACFNVIFPLRLNLDLAARVLKPLLPCVIAVKKIEFEYTGGKGASEWLGEVGGKRGQNCTSIDVAIWWMNDAGKSLLTLVEWKYTERNFGTCGGYESDGNSQKHLCKGPFSPGNCYLQNMKKRHYFRHLSDAGIVLKKLDDAHSCPFRGPFYQLVRQFLLAAYLRSLDEVEGIHVDEVNVASVSFRGNKSIHAVPRELRSLGNTVIEAWNNLLKGVPMLRHVEVEDIVAELKNVASPEVHVLCNYLHERYGL